MIDNCITRLTHWWGSGARLAATVLLIAAMIGAGATRADGPAPAHALSAPVHLLGAPSPTGPDAFTIGSYTFDPATTLPLCIGTACVGGVEGWSTFPAPVFPGPPLINISGGSLDGINLAPQDFVVYNHAGTVIGSVDTAGTIIKIAGQPSYDFTVTSGTSVAGGTLPETGSVYDIFNFGLPIPGLPAFTNVYEGDPSGTPKDVMVLSNGQYSLASPVPLPNNGGTLNLASLLTQSFTGDMNPSAAFSNLVATSGNSSIGPDAFTINVPGFHYTLDPFSGLTPDTYTAVSPLASFPPVLSAGGANAFGISAVTQGFNVYNGSTHEGSFTASEGVTQLLGLTTVQEAVTGQTVALGGSAAALPPVGTVFSVTNLAPWNFGHDLDLVYVATPSGATQTLVTSLGDITMPAFFNVNSAGTAGSATIATNPSNIFGPLAAEQAPVNSHIATPTLGPTAPPGGLAFTINGTTFYPETSLLGAGFNNIDLTTGGAPLLAAFGGTGAGISLGSQDFFYYNSDAPGATDDGGVSSSMAIVDFLFMKNAAFTITGCATLICTDAPATGTVFDVLQLFPGVFNLYEGTPGGNVSDIIVTPLGPLFDVQLLLPPSMDAAVDLTPADIVPAGLDVPLA